MLILSRQKDESICIEYKSGKKIEVYVVSIKRNKVKLGIEAPAEVHIYRKEIYKELRGKNKGAKKLRGGLEKTL